METLNVKQGNRILDAFCGAGRHCVSMARKGLKITAIDISKEFITRLRARINEENLTIETIQENILSLELEGSFNGAFCMGNSFGYFKYDDMKTFVKKVAACLQPGSRFVINSGMMAESILPKIPPDKSFVLDDLTMHVENEYALRDSCLISSLKYNKGDFAEEHRFKHYVYTIAEIDRLLKAEGLNILFMYNSVKKTAYKIGDAQVYLVAEKQGG
jgi:cyclopropane fatty-acyl-phospholipid synthase-like methyltransferase